MAMDSCGAKTRAGKPCENPAGHGTDHPGVGRCRFHGGASPQAQLAGVVQLARREAQVMGRPMNIEPHQAILECIAITAGEVWYASEKIGELDDGDATGPLTTTVDRDAHGGDQAVSYTQTTEGPPALNIWIAVRRQAMDRLVTYSATALKAGVEERLVRVYEQQGQMLASAVDAILRELGVRDHPEAPRVVRRHLTALAGGNAAV